jgi:hypothetical protein
MLLHEQCALYLCLHQRQMGAVNANDIHLLMFNK